MSDEPNFESLLDRMYDWAVASGLEATWNTDNPKKTRNLWVSLRYSGGAATAVVAATEHLVSSTVYDIDKLPENEALPLVLGLVCRVNERLTLSKFSANTDTGEVRASVLLPRLPGVSEDDLFAALVGGTINGLEIWLDAIRRLIKLTE